MVLWRNDPRLITGYLAGTRNRVAGATNLISISTETLSHDSFAYFTRHMVHVQPENMSQIYGSNCTRQIHRI
jgi:hypothetical protein